MKNNILLFIILSTFSISCHRKTAVSASQDTAHTEIHPTALPIFLKQLSIKDTAYLSQDTLMYFKRGACFGFCASYEFTLYKNGLVHYIGYNNTEPLGSHFGLLNLSQWTQLINKANEIKIFDMADAYPTDIKTYIPDLPSTFILVKDNGKRKWISDNHSSPKELKEFELQFDGMMWTLKLQSFAN